MAKWQQKYRADWDRYRKAGMEELSEQCENFLMEMERFNGAFECVSLPVVWGLGDTFQFFHERSCACFAVMLRTREGWRSKDVRQSHCEPSRPFYQDASGVVLPWRIVLQDALSEVTKIYPPLKLRVFVDDITALLTGRNQVFGGEGGKSAEEVERGSGGEGLDIVEH